MNGVSTKIAASLQGDREAFGEIIREYQNTVCAITYSITGNLQQSEDLAQEAFVTAWLKLKELQDVSKFPAWLCGIARNLAHNWMRKNAREKTPVPQSELVENIATAPQATDRESEAAMVWEILQELPEPYREPLVLYYQQSQSIGEIAAVLDLSEANVRQRLSRGRAKIRAEVAQRVEQALTALRPDTMFTLAVLAALPVATLSTTQAVAATFAAITGGTSGSGTVGTAVGATTIGGMILNLLIGAFWILFFPALFVFAVIANYASLRDLPTLRSRRALLKYHLLLMGIIFVLMTLMIVMPLLLIPLKLISANSMSAYVVAFTFLPMSAFIFGVVSQMKIRKTLEEDLGKRDAPEVPLEESPFAFRSIKRTARFTAVAVSTFIAICMGLFGGLLVVSSFSISPLASIAAGLVTFVVIAVLSYLVVRFLQLLLVMATEEGMLRFPPKETYTVLKFKPQNRWWQKQETEKPLQMRDYLIVTIPGVVFAMILLSACYGMNLSGANVDFGLFLIAILPPMMIGPIALHVLKSQKNARIKAGNVVGIFSILWLLYAITWLLFEPLAERWGKETIYNYATILTVILVFSVIAMVVARQKPET